MTGLMSRWGFFFAIHAFAIHAAGTGYRVSIGYQSIDFAFDPAAIGLVAATLAAPPIFASLQAGIWADRFGGYLVTVVGDLLVAISCLITLLILTPVALFVGAALHGIGMLLSLLGQQALVGASVPPEQAERAFGNLFTANAIGQGAGPLAATGLATIATGWTTAVSGFVAAFALALTAVAAAPFIYRRGSASSAGTAQPRAAHAIRTVSETKGAWPVIFLNAVLIAVVDILSIFLPMWGQERAIPPAIVGLLLAVRAGASILIRIFMAPIVALVGRARLLTLCTILMAVGFGGLTQLGVIAASGCMVLIGIGIGLSSPITLAWLSVNVPAHIRGSAMGIRMTANRVAQAALPAAMGAVSGGTTTIFAASALCVAGATLLIGRIPFRNRT